MARNSTPVLVIANAYPPENITGALRPYHFCRYMPQFGYEPHVIAGAMDSGVEEDPCVDRVPDGSRNHFWLRLQHRVARGLRRLAPYEERYPWIPYVVDKARTLLPSAGYRVIFSTSPPLSCHLAALFIKRRYGIPWVADFRDPLVGNPFRTRARGRVYDKVLEWLIFSHADVLIANTDSALAEWAVRYPKWKGKFHLIWNGFDSAADPLVRGPKRTSGPAVMIHLGTIYGARRPDQVLSAVAQLISKGLLTPSAVRIKLIGNSALPANICDRFPYSELSRQSCLLYRPQAVPRDVALSELAAADYLLLIDNSHAGTAVQVPAKLFEYIRTGKPIIAITSPASPASRILKQSGVPYVCVYPNDSEATVEMSILDLLSNPNAGHIPNEWFQRTFDANNRARLLTDIFDGLLQREAATEGPIRETVGV